MKIRLAAVGWVFLLMMGVAYFGLSFINLFRIQDYMLRNGLGTILMGLPAVCYLAIRKRTNKENIRFRKLPWKAVLLFPVIAIALEMVTIEINVATSLIFSSYTTDMISSDVSSSNFWISLVCVAVLPAIFEELSFRGMFFREYRAAYGAWAGIIISGFLFGIYHMNMRQFVYAFLCGVFFALLVEATDSIASSMLLHFLMNTISCIAIYAVENMPDTAGEVAEATQKQYLLMQLLAFFPIALIGLGILIVCYIGLAKCCGRFDYIRELFSWNNVTSHRRIGSVQEEGLTGERTPWKWLLSIPFILSVAICICVIIVIEMQAGIS